MKQFIGAIMVLTLLASCQSGPARYSTSGEEVALVNKLISDYEKGDWDAWLAVYSDTAKIYHNTRADAVNAADALERHKQNTAMMKSYEFLDKPIFLEKVIDDDGETWVNFWGYWKGTLAANDETLETAVHLSVQIENGKIVQEHGMWDTAPLVNAIQKLEAKNALSADIKVIDSNVDTFIREFHNNKNASILNEVLAPGYSRYMNGVKVASNAEELAEGFKNTYVKGFPDMTITTEERIYSDNKLYLHWTFRGTNTGEFNGAAPTGNKVEVSGISEAKFNSEGKMLIEKVYYNELDLMNQLAAK